MKAKLLFLCLLAFITALLAFRLKNSNTAQSNTSYQQFKKKIIVSCTPDWESLRDWLDEAEIPPIPGAGSYKWKISTISDSAQFYFNQGINMYYSFHIIESMASFKKATKFDPSCGMLYWAQALAYGPNINDLGYAASPDALTAINQALQFSKGCTDRELMLIKAQEARYSDDETASRDQLNQVYADKMKEAYDKYPDDADVATLYADALMLQHPWDLWRTDGTPKPWTPLIREVLEKSLAKHPENPGTNHYYIHVMEPSPYAELALPSADRLGKLTPGLSHTVHMPSHIYLRTGYYNKGVTVNENAVNSYEKIIPLYSPVTGGDFLYIIHNLHMQTNNAMLAARKGYSVQSAIETMKSLPPEYLESPGALGSYLQYIYMTPTLIDIKFGRWDELLARDQPGKSQVYANLLYHFGRGMAFSHKRDFDNAGKELDMMRELMEDTVLQVPLSPFSAAIEGAKVAEQLLLGDIHLQRSLYDGAIRHFAKADSIEIKMVYNEPRDWLLSPKHHLGNAYLAAGKWKEAESVFLSDLNYNSENGWSLVGLHQSLLKQNKKSEADKVQARLKKATEESDISLEGSVF